MPELGLGLIAIGRPWGHKPSPVPTQDQVDTLLNSALDLGIRFFDTAASYGTSEQQLGEFLRKLSPDRLAQLAVATKFGDHWDAERSTAYVDHSYDALCRSLDRSLELLPRIDILQLHKATAEVMNNTDVRRAFDYARSSGIATWGASVKTLPDARAAIENDAFEYVQFPLHKANASLLPALEWARERHKTILTNRPFDEGKLIYAGDRLARRKARLEAFRFLLRHDFQGTVLTGTQSPAHLKENIESFREAARS